MTSAALTTLGTVSNATGIVGFAIQGVYGLAATYQCVGSPYTTLQETWESLRYIRDRLDAVNRLSPKRRQAIEAAAAMQKCRSLAAIEEEFQNLWDLHTEFTLKYEQSSYIQRHLPGPLRTTIKNLEAHVKTLLVDTWTTTRGQAVLSPLPPPSTEDQGNSTDITSAGRARGCSNPNRESIEMNVV